jgi:16S rRNA (guanine527-N7)-methyltransferase
MASLTELCLPYVKVGGRFIPYKAGECDEEVNEAREAIAVMGGKLLTSERFLVPESDLGRTLVVVKKERPTDKKYPRGGGKPMKNPIVSRET